MEFGREVQSNLGVPQGSIVSPILSNLVLHELDKFVADCQKEQAILNKGEKPTVRNRAYDKIQDRISCITNTERRKKNIGEELDAGRREERKLLILLRATLPSSVPNGKIATYHYVRYADD